MANNDYLRNLHNTLVCENYNSYRKAESMFEQTVCVFTYACLNWNHYRQTSDISHTKSQNSNVYRLVLQLSLPNPLKAGAAFIAYKGTTHIRGWTVLSLWRGSFHTEPYIMTVFHGNMTRDRSPRCAIKGSHVNSRVQRSMFVWLMRTYVPLFHRKTADT